jgi:hypothetical protein
MADTIASTGLPSLLNRLRNSPKGLILSTLAVVTTATQVVVSTYFRAIADAYTRAEIFRLTYDSIAEADSASQSCTVENVSFPGKRLSPFRIQLGASATASTQQMLRRAPLPIQVDPSVQSIKGRFPAPQDDRWLREYQLPDGLGRHESVTLVVRLPSDARILCEVTAESAAPLQSTDQFPPPWGWDLLERMPTTTGFAIWGMTAALLGAAIGMTLSDSPPSPRRRPRRIVAARRQVYSPEPGNASQVAIPNQDSGQPPVRSERKTDEQNP